MIASTANPYKFSASVLEALGGSQAGDELDKVEQLHRLTGCAVPAPLAGLKGRQPRFTEVCDREDMEQAMVRLRSWTTEGVFREKTNAPGIGCDRSAARLPC